MATMARWPHPSALFPVAAIALPAALAVPTLATAPALAQETQSSGEADACFTAAERAQPLMKERRFREARAELEMCARDVCPRVARTDCRDWLADVAAQQPSIVIAVHEVNGRHEVRDVAGVRALVDGGIVVEKVDATPVPLDPGRHRVRVERAGLEPLEQNIELREGEKSRIVTFNWQTPWVAQGRPPGRGSGRPTPVSVWVLGALGVAALGAGTYFEASGFSKRSGLDSCKPTGCLQSRVDDAQSTMRIGDVTLGVGIAMLASAGILYLTRPEERTAPAREEVEWLLGPLPGGVMAGLGGNL